MVGVGHAVVADEVGKLALSSAESSKEIAALVSQAVRKKMNQIDAGAAQTDTLLQRIASAIEQVNANLGNVNQIAHATRAEVEKFAH